MRPEDFDFEAGWDRREPQQAVAVDALLGMVEPLWAPAAIASFELVSGGKANTNYLISHAGGERAMLRIYTRDAGACRREAALHALVAPRVRVPALLYSQPDAAPFGAPYAVLEWLEGESLMAAWASGEEQRALGGALGRTLAAIGSIRFERPAFFAPDLSLAEAGVTDFESYIDSCLEDPASSLRDIAPRLRDFVMRNRDRLPDGDAAVLVHGDYKAGNLLVSRTADGWQVAGVLDWEFAFAGPPLFDLAPLLRFSHRLPPDFETGVIDGLRAAGARVPDGWKKRVRLLDLANLCDFARQGSGAALEAGVRELVERTLRDWDNYV